MGVFSSTFVQHFLSNVIFCEKSACFPILAERSAQTDNSPFLHLFSAAKSQRIEDPFSSVGLLPLLLFHPSTAIFLQPQRRKGAQAPPLLATSL